MKKKNFIEVLKEKSRRGKIQTFRIIDETNAIVYIRSAIFGDVSGDDRKYLAIHKRYVDGIIKSVNSWYCDCCPSVFDPVDIPTSGNVCLIYKGKTKNDCGNIMNNAVYDFKKGAFICDGIWDEIYFINHISEDIFVASLTIKGNHFVRPEYYNQITQRRQKLEISVPEEKYFAFLDKNGSIIGNTLYYGENYYTPSEIFDLSLYGDSIENFKQIRQQKCNETIAGIIKEYGIDENGNCESPFRDEYVAYMLKLTKKNNTQND